MANDAEAMIQFLCNYLLHAIKGVPSIQVRDGIVLTTFVYDSEDSRCPSTQPVLIIEPEGPNSDASIFSSSKNGI